MRTVTRWRNGEKIVTESESTPFGAERAKEILKAGSAFANFDSHMTDGEIAYVLDIWDDLPGSASFYTALCHISRGGGLSFYEAVVAAGLEHDHHASDLYLPATPAALDLMTRYRIRGKPFKSNIDGATWFDIPFMYAPFWDRKPTTV